MLANLKSVVTRKDGARSSQHFILENTTNAIVVRKKNMH